MVFNWVCLNLEWEKCHNNQEKKVSEEFSEEVYSRWCDSETTKKKD